MKMTNEKNLRTRVLQEIVNKGTHKWNIECDQIVDSFPEDTRTELYIALAEKLGRDSNDKESPFKSANYYFKAGKPEKAVEIAKKIFNNQKDRNFDKTKYGSENLFNAVEIIYNHGTDVDKSVVSKRAENIVRDYFRYKGGSCKKSDGALKTLLSRGNQDLVQSMVTDALNDSESQISNVYEVAEKSGAITNPEIQKACAEKMIEQNRLWDLVDAIKEKKIESTSELLNNISTKYLEYVQASDLYNAQYCNRILNNTKELPLETYKIIFDGKIEKFSQMLEGIIVGNKFDIESNIQHNLKTCCEGIGSKQYFEKFGDFIAKYVSALEKITSKDYFAYDKDYFAYEAGYYFYKAISYFIKAGKPEKAVGLIKQFPDPGLVFNDTYKFSEYKSDIVQEAFREAGKSIAEACMGEGEYLIAKAYFNQLGMEKEAEACDLMKRDSDRQKFISGICKKFSPEEADSVKAELRNIEPLVRQLA